MTADTEDGHSGTDALDHGMEQSVLAVGEHSLPASQGRPSCTSAAWRVVVQVGDSLASRWVCYGSHLWFANGNIAVSNGHHSGEVIWPTWPSTVSEEIATSTSPLTDLQQHWDAATGRLRDSAKWMAAVLGAALASVIPTAPLAGLGQHHLSWTSVVLGGCGLLAVSITLVLVLQVMRPQSVSYDQIQDAKKGPLFKWKNIILKHPDLYLPCGVESLSDLRKLVLVEEITLVALAHAREGANADAHDRVDSAQSARAARLYELRAAAAGIVALGVYYNVRARSTVATWGGVSFGLLGIVLVIAAVAWPIK